MEVRINGVLIDSGGATIAIAKQGFDFSDLKKRFLGRTNRFSLPRTSLNREVFKAPDVINSGADSFETFYNVTVEDQGVVLLRGVGILEESGKDYKLQIVDSAKSLFDSLNARLSDLDLSDSDFIFNFDAYADLKTYTGNDTVWVWPFDTQFITNDFTKTLFDPSLKYSRPHFRVDKLIEKSLLDKGWTIEGLDTLGVDIAAISSNHSNFYATGYEALINDTVTEGFILDATADSIFIAPSYFTTSFFVSMPGNATSYRLIGNVVATSEFTIRIKATSDPLGTDVVSSDFFINEGASFVDFITDDFETEELENRVTFECFGAGTLTFSDVKLYSRIEEDSFGDLSQGSTSPGEGVLSEYKIKVFENIPDITQLDLLKEIWTLYAFNFKVNQTTKVISLYVIGDFDRSTAVDWSDKYITESDTVALSKANLGKTTILDYGNDDTVPDAIGGGVFVVPNETLNSEEIYISSNFSASETVDFLDSPVPGVDNPVAVMRIYNETERENSVTIRVKETKNVSSQGYNWDLEAVFTPLNWSVLKDSKYKTIIEALQKGRYIKASFNLNKLDVIGVDFSKPIYIEQLKSYFILANTGNYIAGRLTTCELLKIN